MTPEEWQAIADWARDEMLGEHATGEHRYSFQPECPACLEWEEE